MKQFNTTLRQAVVKNQFYQKLLIKYISFGNVIIAMLKFRSLLKLILFFYCLFLCAVKDIKDT